MWILDSQVVKKESTKSGSDEDDDKGILTKIIFKITTILARVIRAGLHKSDLAWTIYCSHAAA